MTAPEQMLKPCPFCGSTALHRFEHHEGEESHGFQCVQCWMTSPQFASRDEAITAWNTRPAPAELVEALEGVLPYVEAERLAEEAAIRLGAQRAPIRQAVAKARTALRNAGAAS